MPEKNNLADYRNFALKNSNCGEEKGGLRREELEGIFVEKNSM